MQFELKGVEDEGVLFELKGVEVEVEGRRWSRWRLRGCSLRLKGWRLRR